MSSDIPLVMLLKSFLEIALGEIVSQLYNGSTLSQQDSGSLHRAWRHCELWWDCHWDQKNNAYQLIQPSAIA